MKRMIAVLLLLVVFAYSAQAQDDAQMNSGEYLEEVDTSPEILGGISELSKHIKYPKEAAKEGVQGTVFVKAWVNEDGAIDNLDVENSGDVDERLQKSALEAVHQVDFKPGIHAGKAVKCIVVVPVKYRLQ